MNWKGMKRFWPDEGTTRHLHEETEENHETSLSAMIADVSAETRNKDLPIMSLDSYHYVNLFYQNTWFCYVINLLSREWWEWHCD
jgi:hypothetical protein